MGKINKGNAVRLERGKGTLPTLRQPLNTSVGPVLRELLMEAHGEDNQNHILWREWMSGGGNPPHLFLHQRHPIILQMMKARYEDEEEEDKREIKIMTIDSREQGSQGVKRRHYCRIGE